MIVPLSLSLRKKNSLSTRTTHREEIEYLGLCLGELMKFFIENLEKNFRVAKNPSKVDI
jgi:hypothetical protein